MSIVTKESNPELYKALFAEDKTAKEMFEELGYECKIVKFKRDITDIEYIRDYEYSSNIRFKLYNKTFNVWYGKEEQSGGITMEMYKAINKQVEELGWND